MDNLLKIIAIALSILVLSVFAHGENATKERVKGLDEQVQDIKKDVLGIAVELDRLEEKLLYPSNTQISLFVSMKKGETFRLDSVEITLDGKPAATHIYTFKELEALQKGGVQNIYTGNVRSGVHELSVDFKGKTSSGSDFTKTAKTRVRKDVSPKIVEISLAAQEITIK